MSSFLFLFFVLHSALKTSLHPESVSISINGHFNITARQKEMYELAGVPEDSS